jgi:squalene-hopene/tetraprenyl-beta-curcumene cyclase
LEALAVAWDSDLAAELRGEVKAALQRGAEWLAAAVESGRWREPAPIGFYFAKLWYFERLYPVIFATGALVRLAQLK